MRSRLTSNDSRVLAGVTYTIEADYDPRAHVAYISLSTGGAELGLSIGSAFPPAGGGRYAFEGSDPAGATRYGLATGPVRDDRMFAPLRPRPAVLDMKPLIDSLYGDGPVSAEEYQRLVLQSRTSVGPAVDERGRRFIEAMAAAGKALAANGDQNPRFEDLLRLARERVKSASPGAAPPE